MMIKDAFTVALERFQAGDLLKAATLCQDIPPIHPDAGRAVHLRAIIASMKEDFEQASTFSLRATCINPENADFLTDLSALARCNGQHDLAIASARRALVINANHMLAHKNLLAARDNIKRRHELALSDLAQGIAWHQSGDVQGAVKAFARAVRHDPNLADAHYLLGSIYLVQSDNVAAQDHLSVAICLQPSSAFALGNLGTALSNQTKYAEGVMLFGRALSLVPEYLDGHYNLANALAQINQLEDSVIGFRRSLCLMPSHQGSLVNMAASCLLLRQLGDIRHMFDRALRLHPNDDNCTLNQALFQLAQGDFVNGWQNYEHRQSALDLRGHAPIWDGRDLGDGTLLIRFEQGIGDTLQFVRFARLAQERTKNVVVQVQKSIIALIARAYPELSVLGSDEPVPYHDAIIALMSLPRLFGINADNIPCPEPYLSADPARVTFWANELRSSPRLRIGIAWSGNPDLKNDHLRSTQLMQWQGLLGLEDIEFHVLQFPVREADRQHLSLFQNLVAHPAERMGFDDTAALIMNMDLIITIDTSIAHLAAALGQPTWILLAYMCDWRWMLERDDTPWYQSVRLFRQHADRSWQTVMSDIRQALIALP